MSKNTENRIIDYATLAGAIAYFVLPIDAIPDVMAGIGYMDDMSVLTMAFKSAHSIFTQSAKDSAIGKAAEIFGDRFDPEMAAKVVSGKISKKK